MGVEQDFSEGQYPQVISDLSRTRPSTARGWALLGISHLRLGQLHQAEDPLQRALALGDAEAAVEYGNLLRAEGRFSDADRHFRTHEPEPGTELHARWLRWWGVTAFQAGEIEDGIHRVETASRAYLALGDEAGAARTSVSLARMLVRSGHTDRAARLYRTVLPTLPAHPNPLPKLSALAGWLDLLLAGGDVTNRDAVLREVTALLQETPSEHARLPVMASVAQLHAQQGHWRQSARVLEDMTALGDGMQGYEARSWVYTHLAEHHARQGRFTQAHALLHRGPEVGRPSGNELFVKGLIAARQGILSKARPMFEAALEQANLERRALLAARAELHLASVLYTDGHPEALSVLERAVERIQHLNLNAAIQYDLDDCAEVLFAGLMDPYLAALIEPVRPDRGPLRAVALNDPIQHLEIRTLGRPEVRLEGETLNVSAHTTALLTLLAQKPRLTRGDLERTLYPDKPPTAATAAVKAHLLEVRRALGGDAIQRTGHYHAQHYALGPRLAVTLDVVVLEQALQTSRTSLILATNRGPFLPEHHSDWASEQREYLQAKVSAYMVSAAASARRREAYREAEQLCSAHLSSHPEDLAVHAERITAAQALHDPVKLQTAVVSAQQSGLDISVHQSAPSQT